MAVLAFLVFAVWLVKGLDLVIGYSFFVPQIRDEGKAGLSDLRPPKVSVIFACRNEGRKVAAAVRSMLDQDHPDFEVVAVNDRSTDESVRVLRELQGKPFDTAQGKPFDTAQGKPRFKLVEVRELPNGWLGKTHALQKGYEASEGEWLLFTDADVKMHPQTLRLAVAAAQKWGRGHMSAFPDMEVGGLLEAVFIDAFILAFNFLYRPWAARFPRSKAFVGMGAFNLIRRDAYEKLGTHKALPMDVADDMVLGKLAKQAGVPSMAQFGTGLVSVRWFEGWKGAVRSLSKNGFTGVHYNYVLLLAATAASVLFNFMPYAWLFAADGAVRWFGAGAIGMNGLIHLGRFRTDRWSLAAFPFYPLGAAALLAVIWYSALSVLRHGGVRWRGTFYSIDQLKRYHRL